MTDIEWQARLPSVLEELAKAESCISYRALAERLEVKSPLRIRKTAEELDKLIRADHAAGRPLRSAVVVSARQAGLPARGFFWTCRDIGRYFGPEKGPQATLFHSLELRRLYAEFAG